MRKWHIANNFDVHFYFNLIQYEPPLVLPSLGLPVELDLEYANYMHI